MERTNTEAEASIFWPPDVKSWLTGKDPDAGKDWGQKEKGMAENEMVRQHHQLNGHEFEQTPEDMEDRGDAVHEVIKSQTQLSHWTTCAHDTDKRSQIRNFYTKHQTPTPQPLSKSLFDQTAWEIHVHRCSVGRYQAKRSGPPFLVFPPFPSLPRYVC